MKFLMLAEVFRFFLPIFSEMFSGPLPIFCRFQVFLLCSQQITESTHGLNQTKGTDHSQCSPSSEEDKRETQIQHATVVNQPQSLDSEEFEEDTFTTQLH
jgi:hypothetical protein